MRWLWVVAVALAVTGCGDTEIGGDPTPRAENQYRDRVLDQLDLPLPQFTNWEVVDAAERPAPFRTFARLGTAAPDECGPDGALGAALWDALGVGDRWTSTHGTGPDGEVFDVVVTSHRAGSVDDVDTFLNRCATTTYMGTANTVTVAATPLPALPSVAYGLTLHIADATPAALTVSYVVAQPESLRLLLAYATTGPHAVGELWERALERFAKPR